MIFVFYLKQYKLNFQSTFCNYKPSNSCTKVSFKYESHSYAISSSCLGVLSTNKTLFSLSHPNLPPFLFPEQHHHLLPEVKVCFSYIIVKNLLTFPSAAGLLAYWFLYLDFWLIPGECYRRLYSFSRVHFGVLLAFSSLLSTHII